jgi:hypothetical protein
MVIIGKRAHIDPLSAFLMCPQVGSNSFIGRADTPIVQGNSRLYCCGVPIQIEHWKSN